MSLHDPIEAVMAEGPQAPDPPASMASKVGKAYAMFAALCLGSALVVGLVPALTLFCMAAMAGLLIGLRFPSIGLISAAVLCCLDPINRVLIFTGGLFRWNTLNYIFLLIILVKLGTVYVGRTLQSVTLGAFVAVMLLYLLPSSDRAEGVQHILGVLAFFALQSLYLAAGDDPDRYYWAGIVSGVVGAVGGTSYLLLEQGLPHINRNTWAFFPLTCLFSLLLALPCSVTRPRFVAVMALGMVNYAWVFLSASRGGLLAATCCLGYMLATVPGLSQRILVISLGGLLAVVVSASFTELQESTLLRLHKTLDAKRSLSNRSSGRNELALAGWRLFLDHPLGVGTGGFEQAYAEAGTMAGSIHFRAGKRFSAHAGWIMAMVETGVIGASLLAGFVLSFSGISRHAPSRFRAMGIVIAGILALSLCFTEFQGKGLWLLAAGASTLFSTFFGPPWPRR